MGIFTVPEKAQYTDETYRKSIHFYNDYFEIKIPRKNLLTLAPLFDNKLVRWSGGKILPHNVSSLIYGAYGIDEYQYFNRIPKIPSMIAYKRGNLEIRSKKSRTFEEVTEVIVSVEQLFAHHLLAGVDVQCYGQFTLKSSPRSPSNLRGTNSVLSINWNQEKSSFELKTGQLLPVYDEKELDITILDNYLD